MSIDISAALEAASGPKWLQDRHAAAAARLASASVPSATAEEWRYTRIDKLDLTAFTPATAPAPSSAPPAVEAVISASDADAVVWTVDGTVGGVRGDIDAAPVEHPLLGSAFSRADDDALAQLHDALAVPVVVAPSGDARVLIVHAVVTDGSVSAPRVLVVAEPGRFVEVVEVFVGPDAISALSLPVVELIVGRDATISHGAINLLGDRVWALGAVSGTVAENGTLRSGAASFGGDVARTRFDTSLAGRGASTALSAASFGSSDQLLDFRTFINHDAPDTTSELLFVGALGEQSGSVYTGLIKIAPDARRSNAFQTNRNLKLSDDCWAESVPNLEIENNEVHCSHASVFSPVDPEHRFYLESRGVPADRAERLLVRGFFDDIIEKVPTLGLETLIADRIDTELERTLG